MSKKTATAAGLLLGCLFTSAFAQQATCVAYGTDLVVEGNTTSDICLKTVNGNTPRRFSHQLFGSGTWQFDNGDTIPAPTTGNLSLNVTNGVNGTEQHYALKTAGLPITGPTPSTANYGQFVFCYKPALNEVCMTPEFTQRVRLRVDPIVRLDVAGPITTSGTTPVVATLGALTASPTVGAVVNATCTQANGAVVSVSPSSRTTDATGSTQPFTITTSNLVVYASSGNAPSGTCTFSTAAGSKSATIAIQGQRLSPTVSSDPFSVSLPTGSTSHTRRFTVSTSPSAPNASIAAVCTGSDGGVVSPASATLTTNASGVATLDVTTSSMVVIAPSPAPKVQCAFTLGSLQPATSTIVGVQLFRTVELTPNVITGPGLIPITANISRAYPGFRIYASCSSSRPDVPVSVTPANAETDTQGRVAFTVSALQLGFADPNLAANPNARCDFHLVAGFATTIFPPFSNACTSSLLSPLPAVCGNPQ